MKARRQMDSIYDITTAQVGVRSKKLGLKDKSLGVQGYRKNQFRGAITAPLV